MNLSKNLRWCTISYWEYNKPCNKQFHVLDQDCLIYQDLNEWTHLPSSGMCLQTLQGSTESREIFKARDLIGSGIKISVDKVNKLIRLENNCKSTVYWTCPGLYNSEALDQRSFKSNSINMNESTIVYSYDMRKSLSSEETDCLYEKNVINISFGKYWGHDSKRRKSIEYCPCWINISINENYFK